MKISSNLIFVDRNWKKWAYVCVKLDLYSACLTRICILNLISVAFIVSVLTDGQDIAVSTRFEPDELKVYVICRVENVIATN